MSPWVLSSIHIQRAPHLMTAAGHQELEMAVVVCHSLRLGNLGIVFMQRMNADDNPHPVHAANLKHVLLHTVYKKLHASESI